MAEKGSRRPASTGTALENIWEMQQDPGGLPVSEGMADQITRGLRQELQRKGLKGFRRGGKVKKTGVAKVHKGERVLTAKQAKTYARTRPAAAKKAAPKRAAPKRAASRPTRRRR